MSPPAIAHIRGVWPRRASVTFTSAPLSSSSRTRSKLPPCTAARSGVSPLQRVASMAASASRSRRAIARLPRAQARSSGVSPFSSEVFGLAPARSKAATNSASPRIEAHNKGVEPSGLATLTSTPLAISVVVAVRSSRWTASISGIPVSRRCRGSWDAVSGTVTPRAITHPNACAVPM